MITGRVGQGFDPPLSDPTVLRAQKFLSEPGTVGQYPVLRVVLKSTGLGAKAQIFY